MAELPPHLVQLPRWAGCNHHDDAVVFMIPLPPHLVQLPRGAGSSHHDDTIVVRIQRLVVGVVELRRGGARSAQGGGAGRPATAAAPGAALDLGERGRELIKRSWRNLMKLN